jgi:hypothetical protein
MPFNLPAFRAQVTGDLARPNLFQMNMPFPIGLAIDLGLVQEKLSFFCHTSQLPGETIGELSQYYFGREIKFPGNATYQPLTLTVVNDEDYVTRIAFERWMGLINSHAGNLRNPAFLQASGGYAVDGLITQFSKTGPAIRSYKFVGMWPSDLSPIDVSWSSNDQAEEYTVTIPFQWWEVVGESVASGIGSEN